MILFILTVCLKSQMASSQLMPTATLLSPLKEQKLRNKGRKQERDILNFTDR